jgi:integrase
MATSLLLFAPSVLAVSPPKREPAPALLAKLTLEDLVARANAYATTETRASSTRKAYLTDFRSFEGWCQEHGLASLPATPATVAVYLAALAGQGRRPSTLERALAGIAYAHRARGCAWPMRAPAIANVMKGIRRRHGTAPAQKAPLNDADIEAMVAVLDDDLVGRRDRALLTLEWMGAFRRSELVALRVEDVTRTREGLVLRVRRSKGDQEGPRKAFLGPPTRPSARSGRSRPGSRPRASRQGRSSGPLTGTGGSTRTPSATGASRASYSGSRRRRGSTRGRWRGTRCGRALRRRRRGRAAASTRSCGRRSTGPSGSPGATSGTEGCSEDNAATGLV